MLEPMHIPEEQVSISLLGLGRKISMILPRLALQEAVCSVVLKTLSQALNNGDTIESVIRETGINQDGRTTDITMPNHDPQEALIRATYARAGLNINDPQERCRFFEAHGKRPSH